MQIKVMGVPVIGGEAEGEALNKFLRGQRVVQMSKKLIEEGGRYYWAFCVTYIHTPQGSKEAAPPGQKGTPDYKELLDEASFKRFVGLKQTRKEVAEANAVPYYAVFTNEELSQIAQLEVLTEPGLLAIPGIGKKKVEKWGSYFIKSTDHEKEQGADTSDDGV